MTNFRRAMATRDAIRRQHRSKLLDELDQANDDSIWFESNTGGHYNDPTCANCHCVTPNIGYHINPETGGYTCDPTD